MTLFEKNSREADILKFLYQDFRVEQETKNGINAFYLTNKSKFFWQSNTVQLDCYQSNDNIYSWIIATKENGSWKYTDKFLNVAVKPYILELAADKYLGKPVVDAKGTNRNYLPHLNGIEDFYWVGDSLAMNLYHSTDNSLISYYGRICLYDLINGAPVNLTFPTPFGFIGAHLLPKNAIKIKVLEHFNSTKKKGRIL